MKPPAGDTDHAHSFIKSRPSSEFVRWSRTYRVARPSVTNRTADVPPLGKKRTKTIAEIAAAVALPRKRVLEEAVKLAHKQIITKTRRGGDMAYERDNFYY